MFVVDLFRSFVVCGICLDNIPFASFAKERYPVGITGRAEATVFLPLVGDNQRSLLWQTIWLEAVHTDLPNGNGGRPIAFCPYLNGVGPVYATSPRHITHTDVVCAIGWCSPGVYARSDVVGVRLNFGIAFVIILGVVYGVAFIVFARTIAIKVIIIESDTLPMFVKEF